MSTRKSFLYEGDTIGSTIGPTHFISLCGASVLFLFKFSRNRRIDSNFLALKIGLDDRHADQGRSACRHGRPVGVEWSI